MTDDLTARLEQLEVSARRAAESIERLRAERETLLARVQALEAERAELRLLREERKEVLVQVESILKELDRLDL